MGKSLCLKIYCRNNYIIFHLLISMKRVSFFVFFLSLLLVSAVEEVSFVPGKSFQVYDKNITLIKIDDKYRVAVFCVNGVKGIVEEDVVKVINDVKIDVIDIEKATVSTELDYMCKRECECKINCDNTHCSIKETVPREDLKPSPLAKETPIIIDEREKKKDETYVEPLSLGKSSLIIATLIIVVLILGLVALWRRVP